MQSNLERHKVVVGLLILNNIIKDFSFEFSYFMPRENEK